jgi:hypothetical protein
MKTIKMNWGAGIAATYAGFVLMILVLVAMSAGQKIDLVTDHYYEDELKFQDKINKTERSNALQKSLVWQLTENGLIIQYPEDFNDQTLGGKINLYCPSNDKNDRSFAVKSHENRQFIPLSKVPEGRYKLQIDWKSGEVTYWNEAVIVIGNTDKK